MELENQAPIQEPVETEVVETELQTEIVPTETTEEFSEETVVNPGEVEEPQWQPDFSYRVEDDELEFDETIRDFITDPEREKFVRDLYTKAGGLDKFKSKYEELNTKVNDYYTKVEQDYQAQNQVVDDILNYVQKKDYRNFFKQMDIPEEDVLKYALEIVQYQEMSPDQRQMVDQQRMIQEQNIMLERQNQQYAQQMQQQAVQARTTQLDNELAKAEVSSFAGNFDATFGKEGAFRETVIQQAQLAWFNEGVDLTADQAVQRVMSNYGNLAPQPVATQPTPQPQTPVVPPKAPVIPNVQSSGSSPAKQRVTSLADIRKLAQSLD